MTSSASWKRYVQHLCTVDSLNLSLDASKMRFTDAWLASMRPALTKAFDDMEQLERGAIANPDEGRKVGHYWLRAPELAAADEAKAIRDALAQVKAFAKSVHEGQLVSQRGKRFTQLLVVGIGGSALGPQLATDALGEVTDRMTLHFFDNTDPDGFDRVFARLGSRLDETLVIVISKSGGTKETRNGMVEAQAAFTKLGLDFVKHAVAVTSTGSELDKVAQPWLARFPMWDWVGGRTSQLSPVGLLPAALQGLDIDGLLEGARLADVATRTRDLSTNPAALMALMWHHATKGRGEKDLVVLPYKDRLLLLSRYLQQLLMESLGKEKDLAGNVVNQGLAVYGNKGSTDQHAYVQQLREGVPNFFTLFIEVLKDRPGQGFEVEPNVTSGDYLLGFLLGTRAALDEKGRESMTITVPEVSAKTLGALIAIFERAVGLYASLIGINAYHQPGVEAGKKAATAVLSLQQKVLEAVDGTLRTAEDIAARAKSDDIETTFKLLQHLAANGRLKRARGSRLTDDAFAK